MAAARAPPARQSLPNGPCNYRDAAVGPCGCDQFWDKCSAELHDESAEHRPSSERSTWCVCGHHACFHLRVSRAPERPMPSIAAILPPPQSECNDQRQLLSGSQGSARAGVRQLEGLRSPEGGHTTHAERIKASQAGPGRIEQGRDTPSQTSTTGLPGIPSVHGMDQSRQTVAGLGLSMMHLESIGTINRQQSPTLTIPDDASVARVSRDPYSEPEIPSTRANSVQIETSGTTSLSRGILDQVVEFNRNLQLDVTGDTIPNTYNPDDFIQSATEMATPSVGNTPDLAAADQAVQEGKSLIDTLARLTSNMQQPNGSPRRPVTATSAPEQQLLLTNSPSAPQEQLQTLLRSASPQGLQKLVSYLAPLHNLLTSIPNVANTMRDLGSRLDMLENGSFNYVQPEDLNQTLEMYEGRLIEIEHRMDEHEKYHQAIDDKQSNSSFSSKRIDNVTASFGSNHSLQSTTSSALILATAIDRKDTDMEIGSIKDRLDILEASALPSTLHPWEVDVVLLPWGRELRGIWFSPEEPMHDSARTTTQDSEEWTQAQVSKLDQSLQSLHGSARDIDSTPQSNTRSTAKDSIFSDSESGWSSQAISNWASGSTEDWLFPKGCGSNNLVYKRLQSRGFIRPVTIKSASARDIQATLSNAFSDLLEHLSYTDQDQDPTIAAYPGLRASFIPLRKVLKESKLRFLTPAEMSSSALWSAQFLAAGVMMRVSGGRKRLYVTHREAYMQQSDAMGSSWTWQELRQLPRYQPDQDSRMEGNEEQWQPQVPEADAKEACWQFVETYDAPPASVHSSFGSNQSVQLSMRPADRQWRRSITPSSILKNRLVQPISPLSENHPQRPSHFRNRTASTSVIETFPPGSSKRRFNSSPVKQSSAPQSTARTPSVSIARLKRRRVTNSSSPRPDENVPAEAQVTIWTATPRRSREPPSPFYSSQPALPRTNSDITSRPSQRSVAIVGKSTPFAYATPHSGPFVGGSGFGGYHHGGDTEPDDDDDDDDGEASWRGVTDGDEDSASSSASDAEAGAEEPGSFSGDDSGFESESGDDDGHSGDEGEFGAQRQHADEDDEEEEEDDVFDSLLDVLEH
ncbi:Nn.00g109990.m01.CDS01 [Neocucurbitaria sp. VM-36]